MLINVKIILSPNKKNPNFDNNPYSSTLNYLFSYLQTSFSGKVFNLKILADTDKKNILLDDQIFWFTKTVNIEYGFS